jgi:hypothetical protein
MSNEYYHQLYTAAMNSYNVEYADASADLTRAQANNDFASAVEATRRMAHARTEAAEYHRMSEQFAANLRGPVHREFTREEILAIPDEHQTPELLAKAGVFDSKYGTVEADDPWFQAGKQWAASTKGQQGR